MAKAQKKKQTKKTDTDANLVPRPPVVTLMGHVDHGKTSILDFIRRTHIQTDEAGGITQSIGAYQVDIGTQLKNPQDFEQTKITFIDTPGHEAFTKMRARGGQAADLVVLVIARNDGVQPQTIEAINHAQAAQVPLLVAINKMDLEGQSTSRVKKELAQHSVLVEGFGGEVPCLEISANTGQGINDLLEMILLTAQLQNLTASLQATAEGIIIESRRDPKQGILGSLILRNGQLRTGDIIGTTSTYARLKRLIDWRGHTMTGLLPGAPAEVLGFKDLPAAGETFKGYPSEKVAQEAIHQAPDSFQATATPTTDLSQISLAQLAQPETTQALHLILKADTDGSLDALHHSLEKLETEEVKINFIHQGIGHISESDIDLAAATHALVLGFRVVPDPTALLAARNQKVLHRTYQIIYDLLNEVADVIQGQTAEVQFKVLAQAQVRKVFLLSDKSRIAGCQILEGTLKRNQPAQVMRQETIIGQGRINSLRQGRQTVDLIKEGEECGIGLKPPIEFEVGDLIQTYQS